MKTYPLWAEYAFSFLAAIIATIVSLLIFPFIDLINLAMVYLIATLAVATRGHRGPSALSSLLNVLFFDFFFVSPRFSFTVHNTQYVLTFAVMFLAAMIISHLTIRLRSEAESARKGQKRTAMMHAFTQQLASVRGMEQILRSAVTRLAETFNSAVIIFMSDTTGNLQAKAWFDMSAPGDSSGSFLEIHGLSEKARGIAQWVYARREPAGLGTHFLPADDALYIPLIGTESCLGVIRLKPHLKAELWDNEQRLLLDSFAHQTALSLEVDRLQENAKEAEVEAETERLRSSLLSSVSHDLRTPLTAIVGSASTLIQRDDIKTNRTAVELLETIQQEGDHLSHLVQNILETTRLESGRVQLHKELYPLEEIMGAAIDRMEKYLKGRDVRTDIPEDLPLIPVDAILMGQVFVNLLENTVRYAPVGPIEITAMQETAHVVVRIQDQGPGLDASELDKIFEKFYKGRNSTGTGLGLAICRAIVNAHGGMISAENRNGGGATFILSLPLEKSDGH